MDKDLDKRLGAIEKGLAELLKRTDPRRSEVPGGIRNLREELTRPTPRRGYAGVPDGDPRLRSGP